MSTALPEPLHLEPEDTSDTTATRHLRSVPEQKLTIRQVSRPDLLATVQRPQLALPLTDPADEYAPQQLRRTHHRSEEHTSELQSRFDIVCRLLLEKKKKLCTHF